MFTFPSYHVSSERLTPTEQNCLKHKIYCFSAQEKGAKAAKISINAILALCFFLAACVSEIICGVCMQGIAGVDWEIKPWLDLANFVYLQVTNLHAQSLKTISEKLTLSTIQNQFILKVNSDIQWKSSYYISQDFTLGVTISNLFIWKTI